MNRALLRQSCSTLLSILLAGCGASTPPQTAPTPESKAPSTTPIPARADEPWPVTPPKRLKLEPLEKDLLGPGPLAVHDGGVLFTSAACVLEYKPAKAPGSVGRTRQIACLDEHERAFISALAAVGRNAWLILRPRREPDVLIGHILELDLDTGATRTLGSSAAAPNAIAVTDGYVWVADHWGLLKLPHRGRVVHAKKNQRTPERLITVDVVNSLSLVFRVNATSVLTTYDDAGLVQFHDSGEQRRVLEQARHTKAGVVFGNAFYGLLSPFTAARVPFSQSEDPVELFSDANATFMALAANEHFVLASGYRTARPDNHRAGTMRLMDRRVDYTEVLDQLPLPFAIAADDENAYVLATDSQNPYCRDGDCVGNLYTMTLAPSVQHRLKKGLSLEDGRAGFELRTAGWTPGAPIKLDIRGETETFGYSAYVADVSADARGQTRHRIAYDELRIPEDAKEKPQAVVSGSGIRLALDVFP